MRPRAFVVSTVFHAVAIALLLLAAVLAPPITVPLSPTIITILPPLVRPPRLEVQRPASKGGGQKSESPARKGQPLTRPAARPFLPPQVARAETPQLVIVPAMMGPEVDIRNAAFGVPNGIGTTGLGRGLDFDGIGDGKGPGSGDGDGGIGLGGVYLGKLTRAPQLVFKVEPEYSEEARKARMMGKVILLIEVGLDGRAKNIRVVQGLGLGLDEAAVRAIEKWRFQPALAGDKPVVAPARVEVGFQML